MEKPAAIKVESSAVLKCSAIEIMVFVKGTFDAGEGHNTSGVLWANGMLKMKQALIRGVLQQHPLAILGDKAKFALAGDGDRAEIFAKRRHASKELPQVFFDDLEWMPRSRRNEVEPPEIQIEQMAEILIVDVEDAGAIAGDIPHSFDSRGHLVNQGGLRLQAKDAAIGQDHVGAFGAFPVEAPQNWAFGEVGRWNPVGSQSSVLH